MMILITALGSGGYSAFAAPASVKINEKNFPDPIFRSVIAESDYDRDGNGTLDAKEIGLTINIHCEGMGIESLQGVEYFTDLQGLWCKDNKIKTLDISKNKDLRGLWCSGNLLTSLDLSPNPELLWVYCYDCKLTSLNVADNPKMAFIECNTNPLKTLDVSHNPELEHLTCGTCELKTLDVSKNPKLAHLDAFQNHLTQLDVTHNPKMKRLDVWSNQGLGSIDVSQNPGLQYYNCAYNKATSIDVSHNPQLTKLICSYNQISKLDLSQNTKLVYLDCACNDISKLNLKNNPKLRFLQAFTNPFKTLDIGSNPYLIKTYKEGKKQDESAVCKGHSWTIDYGGDTSTGGDNIFFLCFDDAAKLITKASSTAMAEDPAAVDGEIADPKEVVTREMFAQILYEMAGSPSTAGLKSRFTDVESGAWYENALLWGEKNHICTGYPDVSSDTFGVGRWITRQDVCLMLMRYAELMNYKRDIDFGRSDDYIDYFDVDFDHWEAICWSATWQIMEGKGEPGAPKEEQRIDPLGKATRSEIKAIVKRFLEVNDESAGKFEQIYAKVMKKAPKKAVATDKKSNGFYEMESAKGMAVTFSKMINADATNIAVPDTVTIGGKKYKVTRIAPNAFLNQKKLKKITIGKNIKTIGKKAFYGCKNLKTVKILTTKLKKKTVGKNAFGKIHKKAVVSVPKKRKSAYQKLLKARGITGKKQKIK
ncbi:MAG: leucine-rich repeat protein [Lachnospiraceae bacterium]|nr:leucine-rich repeat protein [Lachnospiraceae bacterium]